MSPIETAGPRRSVRQNVHPLAGLFSASAGTIQSCLGVIKCDTFGQYVPLAVRSRTKISQDDSSCDSHFIFILSFGYIKRARCCLVLEMDQKSDRDKRLFSETRQKLARYGKRLI